MKNKMKRGYTLIELIVAVGLFALVMLLASGAYLVMIGLNRQAQGIATGVDNLAFALETMTRNIRTGSAYNCDYVGDCFPGSKFTFTPADGGASITYALGSQTGSAGLPVGDITVNGAVLTDPSVDIRSLTFYTVGTKNAKSPGGDDFIQPRVTMIVTGWVLVGPGKPPQSFTIETGATMRGTDL